MPATFVYAALLALLFLVLAGRTALMRKRRRVAVGDGGDVALLRAVRAHANFAEYVPLALLLLYFLETAGGPRGLVHALGLSLLLGRTLHAAGISRVREPLALRIAGVALTLTVIGIAAITLLVRALAI